jgi:hypothetical protein
MTYDRAITIESARGLVALGERTRASKGARV